MAASTTRYGFREGTGAASLDTVIMGIPLGREFTVEEVDAEVRRRGLPARGAVREHFQALKNRGFIEKSENGWVRVS